MDSFAGKRVLIIGAARQGQAAARYLATHGAQVTLNDNRPSAALASAINSLQDLHLTLEFGAHPLSLLDNTDLVCLSGGIPLDLPIIMEAVRRQIPLTNDTQVFLEVVPCQSVGITGSAGKTTTTSLLGTIAHQAYQNRSGHVWVGGNIGDPLLNHVDGMKPDDLAILEVSSFQLEQMTTSTHIAAVLNITPNHLDRHKTMQAYRSAKARLIQFQPKDSISILGRDDPGSWELRSMVKGQLLSFGFSAMPAGSDGMMFANDKYHLVTKSGSQELLDSKVVHLRGDHNKLNIMAASLIAHAAGFSAPDITSAVNTFTGVPHRLQFIRSWGGADWYNDSIATAPERTIAAIRSFSEPILLLLGGRDKNLPWESLVALADQHARHVILFGEAAEKIEMAFNAQPSSKSKIQRCTSLQEATACAATLVQPGDVVLLSPGGTSFDEFVDFEERGERFQQWVQELS